MTLVESAAAELLKTGVLGALLILVGAYAFWLHRLNIKTQEARVEDQQKVTATLLEFSNSIKDVMRDLRGAIEALKTEVGEQRRTIAEVSRSINTTRERVDAIRLIDDDIKKKVEEIDHCVRESK